MQSNIMRFAQSISAELRVAAVIAAFTAQAIAQSAPPPAAAALLAVGGDVAHELRGIALRR